jgi:hypothetical protein
LSTPVRISRLELARLSIGKSAQEERASARVDSPSFINQAIQELYRLRKRVRDPCKLRAAGQPANDRSDRQAEYSSGAAYGAGFDLVKS